MSLFGFYFVTSRLREAGWPRRQGLLRRQVVDASIADEALNQLPDWAAGLGAGAPTVALQALTQVLADRTGSGITSIRPTILSIRAADPAGRPPQPHFRFAGTYGKSLTSDQLTDRGLNLEMEQVFVAALLWGLALPQRFDSYYRARTHLMSTRLEAMRKPGMQVEAQPNVAQFVLGCEQILKDYERAAGQALPPVPPSLLAEARQLGVLRHVPDRVIRIDAARPVNAIPSESWSASTSA